MTFENTTSRDLPDHNHIGVDWSSFVLGFCVSKYKDFWYLEVGPFYIQWSKYGWKK